MLIPTLIALGLLGCIAWVLWRGRGGPTLREEARDLREFWRRRDLARRRGELFPPKRGDRPGGRTF